MMFGSRSSSTLAPSSIDIELAVAVCVCVLYHTNMFDCGWHVTDRRCRNRAAVER